MLLRKNKKVVMKNFSKGKIDEITAIFPNVVDKSLEITDKKFNMFDILSKNFNYCNMHQDGFKPEIFLLSMISAKSKKMFAITDVPMALTCPYALEKLGLAIKNEEDIMTEGNVRNFINKVVIYEDKENKKIKLKESGHLWIDFFNKVSKEMSKYAKKTNVHILDCVKIPVNIENANYELSTVINYDKKPMRGYKLGVLRAVTETGGIIEKVVEGTIKEHDLNLVEDEIYKTDIISPGEYLIMDRGFLSIRFVTNLFEKGIHVIIPAKKHMIIYKKAKEIAIEENKWKKHPNEKRKGQEIALVTDLIGEWIEESDKTKKPGKEKNKELDFNACVIRISKKEKENKKLVQKLIQDGNEEDSEYVYIVILSTDTNMKAAKIIRTYEQRTEIEEDFRQIKDQWDLATFTSTKYNYIMCHIAMLLLGYNIYSLFKCTKEGEEYINKNMKSVEKQGLYRRCKTSELRFFTKSENNFCILTFKDILITYGKCDEKVQAEIAELV